MRSREQKVTVAAVVEGGMGARWEAASMVMEATAAPMEEAEVEEDVAEGG